MCIKNKIKLLYIFKIRNILMIKINKLHSYAYVSRKFVLFYYYIYI